MADKKNEEAPAKGVKLEPEAPAPTLDVAKKAAAIKESKLPDAHKASYLKQIGDTKEVSDADKIPFSVYAVMRKLDGSSHKAMLAFPKAKGVSKATLIEWDEIFKDFWPKK